jgi:DNA invertase Pin-like site-specific DNA recombinase
MMAAVLATFAQFERRLIGQRTSEALAARRAQGVHTGRRSTLDPIVRERIREAQATGASLASIARMLNAEGVPTGQEGRRWYGSSVAAASRSLLHADSTSNNHVRRQAAH